MNEKAMEMMKGNARRDAHPYWIWESIMQTPQILEQCLGETVTSQVGIVAEKMLEKKVSNLFLLGTGSSYFATIAEKFAFEKIAAYPTFSGLTTEFSSYLPLGFGDSSAVFFHSHSGGTKGDPEAVQLVKEHGGYTVGITDIEGSALDKCVDDSIIGPGGAKVELPATRTYSSAIFRMMQLAVRLGKEKSETRQIALQYEKEMARLPSVLDAASKEYDQIASKDVEVLKNCRSFMVVGAGPNYATADEAALGLSQSSGIPSQAFQLENFLHGPIQTITKDTGIIVVAAPGSLYERLISTARACKVIGTKVALLLPDDADVQEKFDMVRKIPSDFSELLTPLLYMTPLWQLAYHFSMLGKGCHTDRLSMDKPEFKEAFAIIMAGDKKFVK